MDVHLLSEVATSLARVHELSRELESVAYVVRASSPLPVSQAGHGAVDKRRPRLVTVIARTRLDAALAAGPGYCVRHPRTRDGVDERRLSTTCNSQRAPFFSEVPENMSCS